MARAWVEAQATTASWEGIGAVAGLPPVSQYAAPACITSRRLSKASPRK
jgi:hypothetical protein